MEPYRRVLKMLAPRWPLVLTALVLTTISAGTTASYAVVAGFVAESLFGASGALAQGGAAPASAALSFLLPVGGLTIVRGLAMLGAAWAAGKVGAAVGHELRTALYARVASGALPRTLPHYRGDLVSRLNGDVSFVQATLTHFANNLVYIVLSTLFVGGVMVSMDPVLGWAAAIGVPIGYMLLHNLFGSLGALFAALRGDVGLLDSYVEEIVDVGDVVRSLGAEARMTERFERVSAEARRATERLAWISALSKPILPLAGTLGLAAALYWWGRGHAPTAAGMASLLTAGALALRPLQNAADLVEALVTARGSLFRVDEILRAPLPPTQAPVLAPRDVASLEIRELGFSYGERPTLHGITLSLARGRVTAVVGESGAGKTTLLKVIAGLLGPHTGRILVDGEPVDTADIRSYRRLFGWVPQEPRLLIGTVRENVALGRPDASDDELRRALTAAGMWAVIEALPKGLDTMVADDGAPFSVGQRQRLCIARALVTEAPIMVLDEPTAALDELQAEALHVTLDALREHVAVLVATHRLSSVRRADSVLVLDHGRAVEQGPVPEMVHVGRHLRRIFVRELGVTRFDAN